MEHMNSNYDERKFTELILLVAERLRTDLSGGATKLNKVLFFAEFIHVRRTGQPISGAEFQKLEHGPAPRRLKPIRELLVSTGEAEIVREQYLGYTMARLLPLRPSDTSLFTPSEIESVDEAVRDLDGLTAKQVSDLSHEEAGWRLVEAGETIPYEAALVGAPQARTPMAVRLEQAAAQRLGLLAS
jgi:uncharacterized phage-associated protein